MSKIDKYSTISEINKLNAYYKNVETREINKLPKSPPFTLKTLLS